MDPADGSKVHQGILKDIPHPGGAIVLEDLNAQLEDQLLQPGLHLTGQFGELGRGAQRLGPLSGFLVGIWSLVRTLVERLVFGLGFITRIITDIAAMITNDIVGVTAQARLFALVIPC